MAVRVQAEDFDVGAEIRRLTQGRTDVGAIVTFTGTVRGQSGGKPIARMTLEHYPGMTEAELERVEGEAKARWPLQASLIVHRIGALAPGDNIVLVVTASAHRQAAFAAAEFLMDYLKTRAPFWKKEEAPDGSITWVDARESDDTALERWQASDEDSILPGRFDVELFIVHPSIDPAAITATLGLEAARSWRAGEAMRTPKGTSLPGNYPDTRWRHSVTFETKGQHFANEVADLVNRLKPHRTFFEELAASGGSASVIVQFLGDKYFGDNIPRETLEALAELHLEFGIECCNVRQS
jgi:molybdopterin synthase catalytic subunit